MHINFLKCLLICSISNNGVFFVGQDLLIQNGVTVLRSLFSSSPSSPRCWNLYSAVHSTCRLPFRIFPVINSGRFAPQKHWFVVHLGLVASFKGKKIFSCADVLTLLDSYLHLTWFCSFLMLLDLKPKHIRSDHSFYFCYGSSK